MIYKGIIFDFNGTLLLDSLWHEKAWLAMAEKFTGNTLSVDDYNEHVHGRTNKVILNFLLGREPNEQELNEMQEEKEAFYRNICLNLNDAFSLAPGVVSFLNKVNELNIERTIATGSYWGNVQFYIDHLGLEKWFNPSLFVFDDNTFPGKPAPDVFIKAAAKLHLYPHECVVFEDSIAGIKAAHAAGIGRIYCVEPLLTSQAIEQAGGVYKHLNGFENLNVEECIL